MIQLYRTYYDSYYILYYGTPPLKIEFYFIKDKINSDRLRKLCANCLGDHPVGAGWLSPVYSCSCLHVSLLGALWAPSTSLVLLFCLLPVINIIYRYSAFSSAIRYLPVLIYLPVFCSSAIPLSTWPVSVLLCTGPVC